MVAPGSGSLDRIPSPHEWTGARSILCCPSSSNSSRVRPPTRPISPSLPGDPRGPVLTPRLPESAPALAGPARGALDSGHPGDAPAGVTAGPGRGQETAFGPPGFQGSMTYTVKEIFYTLQGEGATRVVRPCSAALPAATCGLDARRIAGGRSAASATLTSLASNGPGGGRFASPPTGHGDAAVVAVLERRAATARRLHGGRTAPPTRRGPASPPSRRGFEVAIETNGTRLRRTASTGSV